jgi:membrane protein DedA with SNARE-associated domain
VIQPVLTAAIALASSPPPLPGFLNALGSPLQHYGLWAIALLVMVEDFGIPVPGETILIAGAVYAGAGRLNIVSVGIVAVIAAVIGDNIGFAIGHFGGRALALRWGKYVFLTEERLDKTEHFFNRHGGKIITIARFVEGLRQANGIIAGISGMHWRRFLAFNALGAVLWVGVWITIGYVSGNHIVAIYNYITRYSYYVLIALAVLVVGYIAWRLWRRRRHGKPTVASEANGSSETQEVIGAEGVSEPSPANEAAGTAPDGQAMPEGQAAPDGQVPHDGHAAPHGRAAPGDLAAPGGSIAPGDHAAPAAPPTSERHSSETT